MPIESILISKLSLSLLVLVKDISLVYNRIIQKFKKLGEKMTDEKAKGLLKKYYGYDDFRRGQQEIIQHILEGKDVLGIMPTGAGKSICYQLPALMLEGVTIVVSPLISLMKDQVDTLCQMGVEAAYINSSLTTSEFNQVLTGARANKYKLLYVAPERLETDSFMDLIQSINISMLAIDEAHCVSQWGHDFRPSYRKIYGITKVIENRPVIAAFTATATPEVKTDIIKLLRLHQPFTLTTGFDRENLYFEVLKPANKLTQLLQYLSKNHDKSGIIYASTRKTVDTLYERLRHKGYAVGKYHAGLTEESRTSAQEDFLCDRLQIMVATNAFGMGIDKSNISYVLHFNMPKNIESYYQEAGRAGRDGEPAECTLLFSPADIVTNRLLIENGSDTDKTGDYQRLNDMVDYCNTDKCLREYILEYFGEIHKEKNCNNCSNCNNEIEAKDITVEAQKIISCIHRMGERFGSVMVADVLRGSKNQRIKDFNFDRLSTYGIMKEYSKETVKELIAFLIAEGYILMTEDQFPVLRLTPMVVDILKGNKKVYIKRAIGAEKPTEQDVALDKDLFNQLKELRRGLAESHRVPPFVIFSDATLKAMATGLPATEEEMLKMPGVGSFKLEKYGGLFIAVIQTYIEENNMTKRVDSDHHVTERTRKEREPKIDTRTVTYELFNNGLSIDEIAAERELTVRTIEGHLLECLEKGMALQMERLLSKEQELLISEAIKQSPNSRLTELKAALPAEIGYGTIRFALHKFNHMGTED